jgi:hypothetical protein
VAQRSTETGGTTGSAGRRRAASRRPSDWTWLPVPWRPTGGEKTQPCCVASSGMRTSRTELAADGQPLVGETAVNLVNDAGMGTRLPVFASSDGRRERLLRAVARLLAGLALLWLAALLAGALGLGRLPGVPLPMPGGGSALGEGAPVGAPAAGGSARRLATRAGPPVATVASRRWAAGRPAAERIGEPTPARVAPEWSRGHRVQSRQLAPHSGDRWASGRPGRPPPLPQSRRRPAGQPAVAPGQRSAADDRIAPRSRARGGAATPLAPGRARAGSPAAAISPRRAGTAPGSSRPNPSAASRRATTQVPLSAGSRAAASPPSAQEPAQSARRRG